MNDNYLRSRMEENQIQHIANSTIAAPRTMPGRLVDLIDHIRQNIRSPRQRFIAANAILLLIFSLAVQVMQPFMATHAYALSKPAQTLVGQSRDDTAKYLTKSKDGTSYDFSVPDQSSPNADHGGRNSSVYSTSVAIDAKQGITYTDTGTKIDIKVTPKFYTAPGQKVSGDHIVYPSGADQLVYTHKYNGLKEDIIVPAYRGDALKYQFTLSLPSGVEARLDGQGNIGIYSADTSLYGNLSFGSDKDRTAIDKARQNAAKTNLVATIPSPIIKDAKGKEYDNKASFTLSGKTTVQTKEAPKDVPAEVAAKIASQTIKNVYTLSVAAKNLKGLPYPISVDPTIQTSTASDFAQGIGDNVDVDTTNSLIKRGALTGGSIAVAATNTASFSYNVHWAGAATWNNYVYLIGGSKGANSAGTANLGSVNTVQYASIDTSTHAINAFTTGANVLPAAIADNKAVAYNGYLYTLTAGGTAVYYSKISSDGSPGAWGTPGTGGTFTLATRDFGMVVYNGYVYVVGGGTVGTPGGVTTVYYSKINADGTLAAWNTTAALGTARRTHVASVYNGYIYAYSGSAPNCCSATGEYSKINSDGTLNTWQALPYGLVNSSGATLARDYSQGWAYNGYLYIQGGCTAQTAGGSCTTSIMNDLSYAPIYADGSIGPWKDYTLTNTGPRDMGNMVFSGGYAYLLDGCSEMLDNSSLGNPCKFGFVIANAQYLAVDPAGMNTPGLADPMLVTNRWADSSAVYNGHVYVAGGCANANGNSGQSGEDNCTTTVTTAQSIETATVNADGTIGSYTTTGMVGFPTPRWNEKLLAYNGWLYAVGGCINGGLGVCTKQVDTIRIQMTSTGSLTGSWTTDSALSVAKSSVFAAIVNGYLFVIGGYTGTYSGTLTAVTTVERALIDPSTGDLGAYSTISPSLPAARLEVSSNLTVWNNTIYVVAGTVGGGGTTDIYYNKVDSSGNLEASWHTNAVVSPSSYPVGVAIVKGYMYILDSGYPSEPMYAGLIASDGSVGAFTQIAAHNNQAENGTTFVANDVIHTVSGCNNFAQPTCGTFPGASAYTYTRVNNGGSGNTSSWTSPQALPATRSFGGGAVANGYLYHVGGCNVSNCGTGEVTTVYFNKILSDGTLTNPWTTATLGLPAARGQAAVVVVGNYLYLIGGENTSQAPTNTTYYSLLDASTGQPGAWATDTNLLNNVLSSTAVASNGYIYLIDGVNSSGNTLSTEYTKVGLNGGAPSNPGCGTVWCATTSLPTGAGASFSDSTVNGGNIYVSGGFVGAGQTVYSSGTYFATLSSTGIGSWTKTSNSFSNARAFVSSFSANGSLYVVGGLVAGPTTTDSVEYAPFLSNGDLGPWQSGTPLPATKSAGATAYTNGSFYYVGGQINGTLQSVVSKSSIQSIQREGTYSRLIDFDKGVQPTKLITRGSQLAAANVSISYQTTNNTSSTFTNSQSASGIGYTGANPTVLSIGAGVTLSRYLYIDYTLDDTLSASFPDVVGGQTTITDYDLYFVPNAGLRLRGGQTFTTQKDRGLQANPL